MFFVLHVDASKAATHTNFEGSNHPSEKKESSSKRQANGAAQHMFPECSGAHPGTTTKGLQRFWLFSAGLAPDRFNLLVDVVRCIN